MSDWKNLLDSYGKPGFISLATSGLASSSDTILAVAYIMGTGEERIEGRLMKAAPKAELDKAHGYHGIDFSAQLAEAVPKEQFDTELARLLSGDVNWFTYNPQFQQRFIEKELGYQPDMLDLSRVARMAMSGLPIGYAETLKDVESEARAHIKEKSIPFKTVCSEAGIECEVPAGVMPHVHACRSLERMYLALGSMPLAVKGRRGSQEG